jgi:hypothetical protein
MCSRRTQRIEGDIHNPIMELSPEDRRDRAKVKNTEGWKALKVLAAEQETTLNALAVEAFNDLLKKHGKRQSVEIHC